VQLKFLLYLLVLFCGVQTHAANIDSLKSALEDAEDVEKINILNELFKSYRNSVPKLALSYAEAAFELSEELNYTKGIATSLNNIGVIYSHRGEFDEALNYFLRAVRVHQQSNEQEEMAFTYGNIGNLYSRKGNFNKAREFYEDAMRIFTERKDSLKLVGIMNNLGNTWKGSGDDQKALELYSTALVIYENLPDKSKAFDPRVNIGDIYFEKGEYESALKYYFESLEVEQEYNDVFQQANLLGNIGIVYKEKGNYVEALQYQNEALEIARSIDDKPLLQLLYKSLSQTYFDAGDLLFAYSYLRLSENLKDSIFNEQSNQKIVELETAYEFEKKDKEIQLLQKDNAIKQLEISNDRIVMTAIILFAIFVLILATMIYMRFMQNQKAKALLEEQNEKIKERNLEIEDQKKIIEDKNIYITEGIEYAKTVQEAILKKKQFQASFPESFIYNKPKDIVSGDFFWYTRKEGIEYIAVIDCTGHGVAGAFMTVIGNSILEQVVSEDHGNSPEKILSRLDLKLMAMLSKSTADHSQHGLDIAMCLVDKKNNSLIFAGAKRPLFYFLKDTFYEIKGSQNSIGDSYLENKQYQEHHIDFNEGDSFYIFSDGYPDQFGGLKNKKFMIRNFKNLLEKIQSKNLSDQESILNQEMKNWMNDEEQTDDILVLGFRITKTL